MRPTPSDVHINQPLSNILIAYFQDPSGFIADKVFPTVGVAHQTDTYYKWDRADFFRVEAAERAPGTPAEGGGFALSTDTYTAKEYAIKKDIVDSVLANADSELHLEEAATRYVGHQLMLKRESVFMSTFFATSVWTGGDGEQTGVSGVPGTDQFKQWDQATSTPIEDIRAQIVAVNENTGFRPNKLVLGPRVWSKLQDHPEFLDRIKYTERGSVTTALLAALLGLDEVLIPYGVQNTAAQGQTAAYSFMASKSALLVYSPNSPSIMAPASGLTFAWTGRFGAGPSGERVKRYRVEEIEANRIEGQMAFAMKQVAADLGVFFASAVA